MSTRLALLVLGVFIAGVALGGGAAYVALRAPFSGLLHPGPAAPRTAETPGGGLHGRNLEAAALARQGRLREAQDAYLEVLTLAVGSDAQEAMGGLAAVRRAMAGGDASKLRQQAAAYRAAASQGTDTGEHYSPESMSILAAACLEAARDVEATAGHPAGAAAGPPARAGSAGTPPASSARRSLRGAARATSSAVKSPAVRALLWKGRAQPGTGEQAGTGVTPTGAPASPARMGSGRPTRSGSTGSRRPPLGPAASLTPPPAGAETPPPRGAPTSSRVRPAAPAAHARVAAPASPPAAGPAPAAPPPAPAAPRVAMVEGVVAAKTNEAALLASPGGIRPVVVTGETRVSGMRRGFGAIARFDALRAWGRITEMGTFVADRVEVTGVPSARAQGRITALGPDFLVLEKSVLVRLDPGTVVLLGGRPTSLDQLIVGQWVHIAGRWTGASFIPGHAGAGVVPSLAAEGIELSGP